MTAQEAKQKSIESVKQEILTIETKINESAEKGDLKLIVDNISPAAQLYFTSSGFSVKITLEPGKEVGSSMKKTISWE